MFLDRLWLALRLFRERRKANYIASTLPMITQLLRERRSFMRVG
jgi:hypothetical protein